MVHDHAAVVLDGGHAPDEEDALQEPVEGNNFANVKREELDGREHGEDDPVSEPLGVIGFVFCFDGLHRDVSWISDADDVAEDLSSISEGEVECDEADKT